MFSWRSAASDATSLWIHAVDPEVLPELLQGAGEEATFRLAALAEEAGEDFRFRTA